MELLRSVLEFVSQTILQELIVVIVGVLVANFIIYRWNEWRYGGWRARIVYQGKIVLDRPLSANKAQALLTEPADLNVFLKGLVSPYAIVHCDLITDGKTYQVYVEDHAQRRMSINVTPPHIQPRPDWKPPAL